MQLAESRVFLILQVLEGCGFREAVPEVPIDLRIAFAASLEVGLELLLVGVAGGTRLRDVCAAPLP